MFEYRLPAALLLAALLAFHGSCVSGAEPEPGPPRQAMLNVKDFGAVGDGQADDTEALQKAFDAAAYTKEGMKDSMALARGMVYLPPGHYRVTRTLKLQRHHWNLVVWGSGGANKFGGKVGQPRVPRAVTQLVWDGDEGGTLLDGDFVQGVELHNLGLIGKEKAGILLRLNRTGRWRLDRVVLADAKMGVEVGEGHPSNGDTSTFLDVWFENLDTGYKQVSVQNLDMLFIACHGGGCRQVWHFAGGGCTEGISCFAIDCEEVIRIDQGGINAGTFTFSNLRVDVNLNWPRVEGKDMSDKRTVILRARGETVVKLTGLDVAAPNVIRGGDDRTPAIFVGDGANVTVESSILTGRVAKLEGKEGGAPGWLQLNNCRFRGFADPRQIECDAHCGYEVRNAIVALDGMVDGKYVQHGAKLLPHHAVYPSAPDRLLAPPPGNPQPAAPAPEAGR
ncbi:MAG: glycoside hydrolase family 55 protein [Planctomycetota bacterium]|nr:glycoside hydrolase family 55 protein [Planctomycetota bacterium]